MKLSDNVIKAYDGPFKWSTTTMVDLCSYEFKMGELYLNNHLPILTSKKYIIRNMSVLPLKD